VAREVEIVTVVNEYGFDRMCEMLMKGASEIFLHESAVRLLIRHAFWIQNEEFQQYIAIYNGGEEAGIDFKSATAAIDAGELVGDEEAVKILRIAASLSIMYPINLREQVEGIDAVNIRHVAEAIMYADGYLHAIADPDPIVQYRG
jgi:hypothetical protein